MMPGSRDEQVPHLRSLLQLVREHDGDLTAVVHWPASASKASTLQVLMQRMGRSGLVARSGRDSVRLTELGDRWLDTADHALLIRIFHNNIQFVGDLLAAIADADSYPTHEELRAVARDIYKLPWTSLDPFRRRTTWLRVTGMVELRFDHTLELTARGRELLQTVELVDVDDLEAPTAVEIADGEISEPSEKAAALIGGLDESSLRGRKAVIGYIPRRSGADVVDSLRFLVSESSPSIERDVFFARCAEKFGIKESSASGAISALIGMGLVAQTGTTSYATTDVAREWIKSGDNLDLVRIIHAHVTFIGEVLDAVEFHDKAPALASYAADHYGFSRHDANGVRTRLHLLLGAGLLQESGWGRYRPTALGFAFRQTIACQEPAVVKQDSDEQYHAGVEEDCPGEPATTAVEAGPRLASELLESARDSENSTRFELAVRDAFRFLGFSAEHLGGSGKTDILVSYGDGPGKQVSIVVDTKASSSGIIEEKAINFDTVEEHRQRHEASGGCVVGPSFHQSRLPARARQRGIALLDAGLLAEAVRRQDRLALTTTQLAKLFDSNVSAAECIGEEWKRAERSLSLFAHVIGILDREANEADEVTHGALSLDNLYFLLRNDMETKPDTKEIEKVVRFLTSPLIEAVVETPKGQYVAGEQPAAIARKLRALADAASLASELQS